MFKLKVDPLRRNNSAFTIVELLVVIVVIGVLAAITIVAYSGISNRATISSMQSDLTNATTTLKLDQVTNSAFPATLALANGGKGITPSQSLDNTIYIPDNTSNPNNFCLQYRKGINTYAVDNTSSVSSGVCLQNLVVNGDFRSGTSGWNTYASTLSASPNLLVTGTGTSIYPQAFRTPLNGNAVNGHKVYGRIVARVTNSSCQNITIQIYKNTGTAISTKIDNPVQNQWYTISNIFAQTQDGDLTIVMLHQYADVATANGKVMEIQYVSVIDLTAAFGAGNEPTKAQMDTMMSSYPNSWFNIVAKANL